MDIFDYIREELLIEQQEVEESIKSRAKNILKDPLKIGATRSAYKRIGKLKKKLGIKPGTLFYIGRAKDVDSLKRAGKVLKKRRGQLMRRSATTGAAAGTGIGIAHRKRKENRS